MGSMTKRFDGLDDTIGKVQGWVERLDRTVEAHTGKLGGHEQRIEENRKELLALQSAGR